MHDEIFMNVRLIVYKRTNNLTLVWYVKDVIIVRLFCFPINWQPYTLATPRNLTVIVAKIVEQFIDSNLLIRN